MQVDLNGAILDAQDAKISPFDAGFLYGDGVFETIRCYEGFAFDLGLHIDRMARAAELLQVPMQTSHDFWRERIHRLLVANELHESQAMLRITLSRGGGPETDQVVANPDELRPVELLFARPLPLHIEEWQLDGVNIMTLQSSFARGNFPQIKSLNYLPSIMAARFARASGFAEACLLSAQGRVLEGASSNIFLISNEILRTPSPRLGVLPGIARERVLKFGRSHGLKVEESASELRDLLVADEVFLTSSLKEVVAVVGIDKSTIGDGSPGPWTRQFQQDYRDSVEAAQRAS